MYKLILDTSTKTLYCALLNDSNVIQEHYIEGRNDHAKNVVSIVEKVLKDNNINVCDLSEIYAGVGPGSYTGVRMAVCVAKMLATNINATLYGVSSLYLMSSGYDGKVLPYIDARRGNSFNALYDNGTLVLEEKLRETEATINSNTEYKAISEDMIKVNPLNVVSHAVKCDNPHGFVPNYLRETEAERNLEK